MKFILKIHNMKSKQEIYNLLRKVADDVTDYDEDCGVIMDEDDCATGAWEIKRQKSELILLEEEEDG
jgi:predicted transcriptional regulator